VTVEELEVLVLALVVQVARLEKRLNEASLPSYEESTEDEVAAGFKRYRARSKEREG
jgi:hypothetical protein